MFQDADWSDEGESPEIDSPSQPLTNGKKKNKKKNKKNTSSTSIGSVNGNSNLKTLTSAVKRKFEKSVDSPNSKKGLISDQSESDGGQRPTPYNLRANELRLHVKFQPPRFTGLAVYR